METANRGEPATITHMPSSDKGRVAAALKEPADTPIYQGESGEVVGITLRDRKQPIRDRAAYMRDYRKRQRGKEAGGAA